MYKLTTFFALVVLASCGSAVRQIPANSFATNPVVAHRGAFKKNNFPENSIASLREAVRLGCTGSEFDVRMSVDDSLLINHDPHYNQLEIEKASYRDLATKKLSNGETIPTLRQYLIAGLANNKSTRLVVEIKPSGISKERGKLVAGRVVKLVEELNATSKVVYISFDYDILKKLIEISPNTPTQYLNGDQTPEQLKADRINGADYNISVFKKHPEWIEAAKKNNIILNAWTVNDEQDMRWLLSSGFEFITTNEPELLLSIVKSLRQTKGS